MTIKNLRDALEAEARAANTLSEAAQDYSRALHNWHDSSDPLEQATLSIAHQAYQRAATDHAYSAIAVCAAQPTTTTQEEAQDA